MSAVPVDSTVQEKNVHLSGLDSNQYRKIINGWRLKLADSSECVEGDAAAKKFALA